MQLDAPDHPRLPSALLEERGRDSTRQAESPVAVLACLSIPGLTVQAESPAPSWCFFFLKKPCTASLNQVDANDREARADEVNAGESLTA